MTGNVIKHIITVLLCGALCFSCSKDEELQAIEELYTMAVNSSDASKAETTSDYLLSVVQYQQEVQAKNPKDLNIELLERASQFVDEVGADDVTISRDKKLNVNAATIKMLSASYYNAMGDQVEAVSAVGQAFESFDLLLDIYPNDIEVRGYRAINYSSLPDLFGKEDTINSDFMFLRDYVLAAENIEQPLATLLPLVFNKAVAYYSERKQADKAAIFTEIIESKF